MRIRIYHARKYEEWGEYAVEAALARFPGGYEHIATLEIENSTSPLTITQMLGLIHQQTENTQLILDWTKNKCVTWYSGNLRSMSPGDMVEISGQFYVLSTVCWEEIDIPLVVIRQ